MRRAQSVRNQTRPSAAFGINVDDLGVLREAEESPEVALRRQLLEKDRENDKVLLIHLQLTQALNNNPAASPDTSSAGPAC